MKNMKWARNNKQIWTPFARWDCMFYNWVAQLLKICWFIHCTLVNTCNVLLCQTHSASLISSGRCSNGAKYDDRSQHKYVKEMSKIGCLFVVYCNLNRKETWRGFVKEVKHILVRWTNMVSWRSNLQTIKLKQNTWR